jgi:DNA repair exonuclease SbcCD ATPase subunit
VSSKQHPFKQWLATGSVAFVASCGCSLPFTQNLAQSALIGLATLPGVAASAILHLRQRQQQLHRQLDRGKSRLHHLQHRGALLDKQLQLRDKDRQDIERRVAQLQSLAASLTARIDRDRHHHPQLEQQLAALTQYCQEQQTLATNLDRKIQDKQARRLEIDTNLNQLKLELSQLQAAKLQAVEEIDRSKIFLQNIQAEIASSTTTKQELTLKIQQLQERQQIDGGSFERANQQQHHLIDELNSTITHSQETHQNLTIEIERLAQIVAERATELIDREQQLALAQQQLSDTESALTLKQAKLDELATELIVRNDELESLPDYLTISLRQRELKIAQLELSSREAELNNLELKLQAKLQEIEEVELEKILQIFEPKPPTLDRNIDTIAIPEAWHDRFIDNPHLPVLQHIEKHGTITEAEASTKLGNARSVRQFANKLEEYAPDLPFSIRVESSPKGNRYIKETQN